MGSAIEKIRQVCWSSKISTNRQDVDDISDELLIQWNGPQINKCDSIVQQARNNHFKGAPCWHFTSKNVRACIHKISLAVDRLNKIESPLTFMN